MQYYKLWRIKVCVWLLTFTVKNGIIYYFTHQKDTLSRKEISQKGSETWADVQFSLECNLNEPTFTG